MSTFTRFVFTPPDGLKDTNSFVSTPVNEAAARKQFQDVLDQLKDSINLLQTQLEATSGAGKIGCTGAYADLQTFVTAINAAGSGTLPPDNTLTETKMANDMKKDIVGGVMSYNKLINLRRNISMGGMV